MFPRLCAVTEQRIKAEGEQRGLHRSPTIHNLVRMADANQLTAVGCFVDAPSDCSHPLPTAAPTSRRC